MSQDNLISALLRRYGETYSSELGLDLAGNVPSDLFRWLCASLLMSAPISSRLAMRAARALADKGWTTPSKLALSKWRDRTSVLNAAGYARFDEKTSTLLGELAEKILEDYGGDLRGLRETAHRDPLTERKLLKEFKGIGDVGADIFCREVQVAWKELYPFADDRTYAAARSLGLPEDITYLSALVEPETFPDLLTALIRADMTGETAASLSRADKAPEDD